MVPLPLFKFAALFVRQISKYGANQIKYQAHEHPSFRAIAAQYGQHMHQFSMRLSVATLKDPNAEKRAKERAEAPTVKTREQTEAEEAAKSKATGKEKRESRPTSIWKRKFRPLPEPKAVDLFADVIGDTFIIAVAMALILYEYIRSSGKPDSTAIKFGQLEEKLKIEEERLAELEERERRQKERVDALEETLQALRTSKPGRKAIQAS